MERVKKCTVCGKVKYESEFSKSYPHRCKECVAKHTKEVRQSAKLQNQETKQESSTIDWERRRFEIAKEIYPHVINRANIKQLERVGSSTVKLADLLIGALKGNEPTENPSKGAKRTKDVPIGEKVLIDGLEYICVDAKDEDCCSCDFLVDGDCKSPSWLLCHMENRDDKKDVKFKIIKQ